VLFFLSGLYLGSRRPTPINTVDTLYVYDTVWHTVYNTDTIYKEKLDTIIFTDSIPVLPTKEDTLRILSRYFAKFVYTGTIADSSVNIVIKDTISQNTIVGRSVSYKLLKPQTIINEITYEPFQRSVAIGGFGAIYDTKAIVGVSGLYQGESSSTGLQIGLNEKFFGISHHKVIFKFK